MSAGIPCVAGERWLVFGTLGTAGDGDASIIAFNNTGLVNITTGPTRRNTSAPHTYMAIVTIPTGCASWMPGFQITMTTPGATFDVSVAGLQAINLTALGLPG